MKERKALLALTGDPVHNGHINIVERSLAAFDILVFAIFSNEDKKPLFSLEQRLDLAKKVFEKFSSKVEIISYSQDMTIDLANKVQACALIRGLRTTGDFNYENQLDLTNRKLSKARYGKEVPTFYVIAEGDHINLSSTMVKALALNGATLDELSLFVPKAVAGALHSRFS